MKRHFIASLLLLLASGTTAFAQNAFRLNLEKPAALKHGKVVVVGGVSSPKGHRTFLEHLSVLQPIDIALLTLNNDDDVELALAKDHYDKPLSAGSTKGNGAVTHK